MNKQIFPFLIPSQSSDNQSGKHGASRLKGRGAPDRRQTQVNNVLSSSPRSVESGSQPLGTSPLLHWLGGHDGHVWARGERGGR